MATRVLAAFIGGAFTATLFGAICFVVFGKKDIGGTKALIDVTYHNSVTDITIGNRVLPVKLMNDSLFQKVEVYSGRYVCAWQSKGQWQFAIIRVNGNGSMYLPSRTTMPVGGSVEVEYATVQVLRL